MTNPYCCLAAEPVLELLAEDQTVFGWTNVTWIGTETTPDEDAWVKAMPPPRGHHVTDQTLHHATSDDYHALCSRLEDWLLRQGVMVTFSEDERGHINFSFIPDADIAKMLDGVDDRKLDALVAAVLAVKKEEQE